MSLEEYRRRREQHERARAVMAMRAAVARAVAAETENPGLVEDAVSEALTQMVAKREHVGDAVGVRERWILYATRRLIDEQRSAEHRHRDPVPVDEHALALAASVSGDLGRATERDKAEWRAREQLNELEGDDSVWAEAWFDELLAESLPAGAQPRGIARRFGWDRVRTKAVSYQARKTMAAFASNYASGVICAQRRALLDGFIAANRDRALPDGLDEKRYKQVLFHIASCDACRAVFNARRRSTVGRAIALLPLPLGGWLADAARGVREQLAGLIGKAHGVTLSVRERLGLGGGTSAIVAGGGAASVGGKVAAGCAALACAAAAGTTALVGVPAVLSPTTHNAHRSAAAHTATQAASTPPSASLASSRVSSPAGGTASAAATARAPARRGSGPSFTPGDLQTASQAPATTPAAPVAQTASLSPTTPSAAPAPRASGAPAGTSAGQPTCTPGDLKC